MDSSQLESKLLQSFPQAQIQARDLTGGGDHWQVDIAAVEFEGKTLVDQHQMVYRALGELMKKDIHALALNTMVLSPDQIRQQSRESEKAPADPTRDPNWREVLKSNLHGNTEEEEK